MAITKSLLTIVLLFDIFLSLSLQENTYRLPKHVAPHHYDIKLIPHITNDEGNFTFDGEASIVLKVFEPTYKITLHILELTIEEWETNLSIYRKDDDAHMDREPFFSFATQHKYDTDKQMLTIHFREQLKPTKMYKLYLKFSGLNEEDRTGFFKTFYIDNEGHKIWLAATFFQPVYARKAFPCWDEPAIKATFRFSIRHYPSYTALSNMPSIRSEVDPIDGKLCTHFEKTPIMSTNILGFVIADYHSISVLSGFKTEIWGPKHLVKNATSLLYVAQTARYELERFTNSTFHVSKIDHVAIPQYPVSNFGGWGMNTYKQSELLEAKSHIFTFDSRIFMIVYGYAQQMFGNLLSPVWWDYVWLSEGISTYLGYYIANTVSTSKDFRFTDVFVVHDILPSLYADSLCLTSFRIICKPININITSHKDVNNAFSRAYTKSGALLRMVSHLMREDVFQTGLIKYLQKHKYGSVTPDDLWEALQDALDESDVQHDDFKLKEVMDTWFNQPAYPVVKIERDYDTGEIVASQHKRVHFWNIIDFEENYAWWIPLNYITKSNLNSSSTLATHWLIPHLGDTVIEGVDKEDWIIVNKQLTGYYRVNYDETNWKRIAAFLNSDDYDKIPILNRAQIIDDVYYMMEIKGLDFVIFFQVINYLWREIDLIAWYPALRVMQSLANSYLRVRETTPILKPYFFNLTYKLFEHIGFDDEFNTNSVAMEIRLEFTKFTCLHDIYFQCREKAVAILLAYMQDPIANKISSDQEYLLCFGLMKAKEHWNHFLQMNTSTNVKFFGCSVHLDIIEKHFSILKQNYSCIDLFLIMFENLPVNVNVINFIINHYEEVAAEFDVLSEARVFVTDFHRKMLNYFTKEDIEKVKRLVKNRTIFLSSEYLNDRLEKLHKIDDNLSKVRSYLHNQNIKLYLINIALNNDKLKSKVE